MKASQVMLSTEYGTETTVVWSELSGKRREVISVGSRGHGRCFGESSPELSLDTRWILELSGESL